MDYSSCHIHPDRERDYDSHKQKEHSPFVVYILCDQLINAMGNALRDTCWQVSLVAETSLIRGLRIRKHLVQIKRFTGNVMETRGQIDLCVEETSPQEFMLVSELPMNCDILLGQNWLERYGCQLQIPSLGITLPAYSYSGAISNYRERTTVSGSKRVARKHFLCI
jgi:hypothetical protein